MLTKSNYMKLWEKGLVEIYEDEPDAVVPNLVSENPYENLDDINDFDLREYQVKVKTENEQIKIRYSRVHERD